MVKMKQLNEFDEYLVPEKIEHWEYRFENNYGAAVNYYRGTNTYDLDTTKWIGDQHIFIDEPHISITQQAKDIVSVLNEIKNKRDTDEDKQTD